MRYVFLVLLFIPVFCSGQERSWSVGINYSPFFYWNYNEKDWNNEGVSYPEPVMDFNGSSYGISVEKKFKSFTLGSGIEFSSQIQGHFLNHPVKDKIYTRHFNYLHLPLYISKYVEIGYNSNLFLGASIGAQISYLTHYKTTYLWIARNLRDGDDLEYLKVKHVFTPFNAHTILGRNYDNDYIIYKENNIDYPFLYNRWQIGVLSNISLNKLVFGNVMIGIGCQFEYDLTDSENPKKKGYFHAEFRGSYEGKPRPRSNNIRLGLKMSLKYLL